LSGKYMIPTHPLLPHMYSLPHYQQLPPEWYICYYNKWTYIDTALSSKSIVYIRVQSCCFTFYRFGQTYNDAMSTIKATYKVVSMP
jgi:hypothetical protein